MSTPTSVCKKVFLYYFYYYKMHTQQQQEQQNKSLKMLTRIKDRREKSKYANKKHLKLPTRDCDV